MHTRNQRSGGFTLIEVIFGIVILLMMTLMFAAVFPMTVRGSKYSNNQSQSALLAQHKLDQFRDAGYDQIDPVNPTFSGWYTALQTGKVIDSGGTAPTSLPYVTTFTTIDVLPDLNTTGHQGFFPTGTVGMIVVSDYHASTNVTLPDGSSTVYQPASDSSVAAGNVKLVTVIIKWPGISGTAGQYIASEMLTSRN